MEEVCVGPGAEWEGRRGGRRMEGVALAEGGCSSDSAWYAFFSFFSPLFFLLSRSRTDASWATRRQYLTYVNSTSSSSFSSVDFSSTHSEALQLVRNDLDYVVRPLRPFSLFRLFVVSGLTISSLAGDALEPHLLRPLGRSPLFLLLHRRLSPTLSPSRVGAFLKTWRRRAGATV